MNLKAKLLNKIADRLKKYSTPEYDKILSLYIKAEIKRVFMTTDCTTIKEQKTKYRDSIVDINKLLDEEFDNTESYYNKEIIFCESDNVVCLYNSKNNSYYEDVYESFEKAEEIVYIKCDSNKTFKTFKNFVNQSSKYHDFIKCEFEIPRKKVFDKLFTEENLIQINGRLSNFEKNNNEDEKSQFKELKHECEYNDIDEKNILRSEKGLNDKER